MNSFLVIPAIDLMNGLCVRLKQGRAGESTVFSADPVGMAQHWVEQGAAMLHIVDLDGAFQGRPVHTELILRVAQSVGVPVQVGGGLRTDDSIEQLLEGGVGRVVLGTRAWSDPEETGRLIQRYGARLAIGIDARDGWVQIRGWTETTKLSALELAQRADEEGVGALIYTDTAQDGMLTGPNVAAVEALCRAVHCSVIASGGVSSPDDLRALKSLGLPNLNGAIVGRALYEERTTLPELLAV